MRKSFYLSSLLFFSFFLSSVVVKAVPVGTDTPVIVSQPRDTTVCQTGTPYFKVAAVDTPGSLPMSYTWFSSTDGKYM